MEKFGYIDFESINSFLRNNGKHLSDDEIMAFIRCIGNENMNRVTYSEYVEIFNNNYTNFN